MLELQTTDPISLCRSAELRFRFFGQAQVELRVPAADRIEVPLIFQVFQGEVSDHVVCPIPCFTGDIVCHRDKALVGQCAHALQRLLWRGLGDPCGRLERPAAGEHAEPTEQVLLLRRQQAVAPRDRVAHGPLPGRKVAWPATASISSGG